jgi:hypothetical protein
MKQVLRYQGYHLAAYIGFGALIGIAVVQAPESAGRAWGLSIGQWVLWSWLFAGLFQAWVLLIWRFELFHGAVTRWLGQRAFPVHRTAFVILGAARFIPLIPISLGTARTSPLSPVSSLVLLVVTTPPVLWTLYSIVAYFGVNRVFGADHFDPAYRTRGLETRGVFRYVPNAMYTLGFLLFYHPGLLWQSRLGLAVAAAHHALVWVHYFCTEKPDLREIYGTRAQ